MSRRGWFVAAIVFSLASAKASQADVAPGPGAPRPAPSARLEQRLERLQQRAAALASGLPSAFPAPSGSAAPTGSVALRALSLEELAKRWSERLATRQQRREQHRALLVRELGQHLSDPDVKAELALHSTRLAELARVEFLAQNARSGEARTRLLARVAKLSAREAARHRARMSKLLASSAAIAPSAAPSGGPATPAPAASEKAPK